MGMCNGYCFSTLPTADSSGERGEGGGIQKKRLEWTGSSHLPLPNGNLAVPKKLGSPLLASLTLKVGWGGGEGGGGHFLYLMGGGNWGRELAPPAQKRGHQHQQG